jgi:hypothetical protein
VLLVVELLVVELPDESSPPPPHALSRIADASPTLQNPHFNLTMNPPGDTYLASLD